MKRLINVLALTLALNFLALAGAVGWLFKAGRLDAAKIADIKAIVFPTPAPPAPATQPVNPDSQPTLRLEELLARHAGRPAAEQLEYIRQTFDSQMARLERAHRELLNLQEQIELAQRKLDADKKKHAGEVAAFSAREEQARKLSEDKGFQDSLALYEALPARQVKTIFMGLDDATMIGYLQAMESRVAARIMKEFRTAEENDRLARVLEQMRQAQASAKE